MTNYARVTLAGAVRRYMARSIDFYFFLALYSIILLLLLFVSQIINNYFVIPESRKIISDDSILAFVIGAFFALPMVIVLEMIWYRYFGVTVGKRLLGLRVTDLDGNLISARDYAKRTGMLVIIGCGLFLPVLSHIYMSYQCMRLKTQNATSYDAGYYQVRVKTETPNQFLARVVLCIVVILLKILVTLCLGLVHKAIQYHY
jgi:uncharacterized RDD family membrane protein YckC